MRVCLVSHRLGGFDGVSVEAAKWIAGFRDLGHHVTRAAGHFVDHEPGDTVIAGMWADRPGGAPPAVDHATIRRLCREHDLLVLDNAGSLDSAPEASASWQRHALDTATPTVVRHHDPPGQDVPPGRGAASHIAAGDVLPLRHPAHLHVLINELTRREFAARWPESARADALRVVHNRVDVDALPHGDRDGTRARLGVQPAETLVVHPARVEGPKKNIPGAVRFALDLAERLASRGREPGRPSQPGRPGTPGTTGTPVRYWLTDDAPATGPVADALRAAPGLLRGHVAHRPDLYAAADLVLLPSRWEGWGLPVVEAAAAGRLVVAGPYPVLDEMRALGLTVYAPYEVDRVAGLLDGRDGRDGPYASDAAAVREANLAVARRAFDLRELPRELGELAEHARRLAAGPEPTP